MEEKKTCSRCKKYTGEKCTKNYYRAEKKNPDDYCPEFEARTWMDDIRIWFDNLPKWQGWLLLRFTICVLAALTALIAVRAIIYIVGAVVYGIELNPAGYLALLLGTLHAFVAWCGAAAIVRLWGYMEEVL